MNLEPLYDLIRRWEGFRARAYLCPAGVWTCGYGSTGPDIRPGTHMTSVEAEQRMRRDAMSSVMSALQLSPCLANDDDKLCAVADFIYNLGATKYKASTLRKRVDAQDWEAAAKEIARWTRGGGRVLPGLVARRADEKALLLK